MRKVSNFIFVILLMLSGCSDDTKGSSTEPTWNNATWNGENWK